MKIFIRADASYKIGTGHVMRCLSLAGELKAKGHEVCFIFRQHLGNLNDFIKQQGFECLELPSPENHPQKISNPKNEYEEWLAVPQLVDAEEVRERVREKGQILIVDHYGLDQTWEAKLRPYFEKIIVIDDLANRPHDCDLLIDQNLQPSIHEKYPSLVPPSAQLCLGPRYALLRPEFSEARKKLNEKNNLLNTVLIFFGGNDVSNESLKALKACLKISSIKKIDLVLGSINQHQKTLFEFSKSFPQVEIHQKVSQMSQLMLQADLALGAGGVTTWERACLGLPSLTWSIGENQESLLRAMEQTGATIYLGKNSSVEEKQIVEVLNQLLKNKEQLLNMSQKCSEIVDGWGVSRVTSQLEALFITLRKVEAKDKKNIFEWRNNPSSRVFSNNAHEISWQDHLQWFDKVINNSKCLFLIAELNDKPVSVIRFDISNEDALTSLYLVPGNSGRGYGSQALHYGSLLVKKEYPSLKLLKAEIADTNIASKKAFAKCGFKPQNSIWVKAL